MNAEIISIGDELLLGQVINTNAAYLGEQLNATDIQVRRITTVGDKKADILEVFAKAWSEMEIILVTGGLGPTHDDITRSAVVEFFDTRLIFSSDVFEDIKSFFANRQRRILDVNRDQAMVPQGARIIRNVNGTAPGYHFHQSGKHFFVLPGVPYEMEGMVISYILPLLKDLIHSRSFYRTILTTGIPESILEERLTDVTSSYKDVGFAFLPSLKGVRVRLRLNGEDEKQAETRLAMVQNSIMERIGEYVFGEGNQSLEEVVGKQLRERKMTISVAESCTGGLITDLLTNIPGSSDYFERGVVTYSNPSKSELLFVDPQLFISYGAVSKEVAIEMAVGIRKNARTSIGISTTGIAGPSGGNPEKPIGLVWIGISTKEFSDAYQFYFGTDRVRNKQRAAYAALDLVRRYICGLTLQSQMFPDQTTTTL